MGEERYRERLSTPVLMVVKIDKRIFDRMRTFVREKKVVARIKCAAGELLQGSRVISKDEAVVPINTQQSLAPWVELEARRPPRVKSGYTMRSLVQAGWF